MIKSSKVITENEYENYMDLINILMKLNMVDNSHLYWGPKANRSTNNPPSSYRIFKIDKRLGKR